MPSKVVTVRLDEESYRRLKEEAERERVSISTLIKRAIDSHHSERDRIQVNTVDILRRVNELERRYQVLQNRVRILEERMSEEG